MIAENVLKINFGARPSFCFDKFSINLVCKGLRIFVSFIYAAFLVLLSVFNFYHLVTDLLLYHVISKAFPFET